MWYKNGQPEFKANYVNDKRHGLRETWNKNGQLRVKENYVNDKRHGLRERWYPPKKGGQQLKVIKENYVDGKKMSKEEYYSQYRKLLIQKSRIVINKVLETEIAF
jgi:antitoxin component YwqK of YwqJK toxin-antitoxin module